jgi:hypothetical protein
MHIEKHKLHPMGINIGEKKEGGEGGFCLLWNLALWAKGITLVFINIRCL